MSKQNRVEYTKSCVYCGERFKAGRRDAEFCSDRCRKACAREAAQLEQLTASLRVADGDYALLMGAGTYSRLRRVLSENQPGVNPKTGLRDMKPIQPAGISADRWEEILDGSGVVRLSRGEVRIINANWPGAIQAALGIGSGGQRETLAFGGTRNSDMRVVEHY